MFMSLWVKSKNFLKVQIFFQLQIVTPAHERGRFRALLTNFPSSFLFSAHCKIWISQGLCFAVKVPTSFSNGSFHTCTLKEQRGKFHGWFNLEQHLHRTSSKKTSSYIRSRAERRASELNALGGNGLTDFTCEILVFTSSKLFVSSDEGRTELRKDALWIFAGKQLKRTCSTATI